MTQVIYLLGGIFLIALLQLGAERYVAKGTLGAKIVQVACFLASVYLLGQFLMGQLPALAVFYELG